VTVQGLTAADRIPGNTETDGVTIMLVLSRGMGEEVVIGDNITITVVQIRGDKVRLGISAPVEHSVHRREVYEVLRRDREAVERAPDCSGEVFG
jgi:carbon storage regulator